MVNTDFFYFGNLKCLISYTTLMEPLQFKLDPLQYPALQKKMVIRLVAIVSALLAAVSVYVLQDATKSDWVFWIVYVVFMILLSAFSMFRSLKKRKKVYDSYMITVDEHGIKRVQDKLNDLYIRFVEVTAIEKKTNNNFRVKGISNNPFEQISIPKQIEDYQTLENALVNIKPITYNTKPSWWENYGYVLSIAITIPLIGVYVIDNKIAVSVCVQLFL